MPIWNVKVRDKRTSQESTLSVNTPLNKDADVKQFVETMPGSHGGTHPGFEVVGVEEVKDAPAAAPAAVTPAEAH